MKLRRIELQHIRSHTKTTLSFNEDTTIITGKNGAGKTSILEAVSIALRGTSFKGTDAALLQKGEQWWKIILETDKDTRIITYEPHKESLRKQYTINNLKSHRLKKTETYPIVTFEPDDMRLLHTSPQKRRQFIDTFLTQIDHHFSVTIRKYERALQQRNNLLKQHHKNQQDFFAWNVGLSEYGAHIIEKRIWALELINKYITEKYREISNNNDTIGVHYSHTIIDNYSQKLLKELEETFLKDSAIGFTTTGPHRHDISFTINEMPANQTASRGETRSIILALKKIEETIIEEITGDAPIILLDDVYGDLDDERQEHLTLSGKNQTIVTATNSKNNKITLEIKTKL